MNFRLIILKSILLVLSITANAQTIDFGSFRGNPFKIGGGIAVGSTFFNSNREAREPFVYNFTGNLNVSLYSFSMPISYNFSNMGGKLSYQVPFNFNRLSLNPRYKWISAYIGDASMTFSPYSLAGHMFTGGGVELTPDGPLKISAMYGRLLKEVNDIHNPNSLPVFERWGYGTKLEFIKAKYKMGLIGFYAKDKENPILYQAVAPSTQNLSPKENLVIGFNFESQLSKDAKIYGDYTNSALVQDTRAIGDSETKGLASLMLKGNATTQNFTAFKFGFDYKFQKMVLGASFERIDPGYQTLGAYFFSNDLQNIMINAARPLFYDKVQVSMNVGIQKDNLDHKKAQTTNRLVGTVNTTIKINDRLSTNFGFTNQSTTTNVNPDQFVQINQNNPAINAINQLNYRQLSNSIMWNTNYQLPESKKAKRNCSFNYNYNQVENEQSGQVNPNQKSAFHNLNALYSHFLIKSKWAFNGSLNYTRNEMAGQDSYTFGPVIGISKKYFKDKLTTQWSTSYNTSKSSSSTASNFNCRFNASYKLFEEHNFNFMASQLVANSISSTNTNAINDLTITFGYNFNFAGTKKKQKQEDEKRVAVASVEKQKVAIQVAGTTHELDSKSIRLLMDDTSKSIDFAGIDELQKEVSDQKTHLQASLDKFDAITDENEKEVLEKSIKKDWERLNIDLKSLNEFTQFYKKSEEDALAKMRKDINRDLVFNTKHLVAKYKLNVSSNDVQNQEEFLALEQQILNEKTKLSKKDIFTMAQMSLYFQLDNPNWNSSFHNSMTAIKKQYYEKFIKAKKTLNIVDELEVKGMDAYVKKYKERFRI